MLLIKQKYHFNSFSNPFEMADENEKLLMELMRKNENPICADCRRKGKFCLVSLKLQKKISLPTKTIIIHSMYRHTHTHTYIIIK